MEIILAQDFQDLTGQVIKKIVELVQGMETQLLAVLLEAMPAERKAAPPRACSTARSLAPRAAVTWSPTRRRSMTCWKAWASEAGMAERRPRRSFRSAI
jgi:hypothetical protein